MSAFYLIKDLADRWDVPANRLERWVKEERFQWAQDEEGRCQSGFEWKFLKEASERPSWRPVFDPQYIYALEEAFGIGPEAGSIQGDLPYHELVVSLGEDSGDKTVEIRTPQTVLAKRMEEAARKTGERINDRRAAALRALYEAAQEIHGQGVAVPPPKEVLAGICAKLVPDLFADNGHSLPSGPGETFSKAMGKADIPIQSGPPKEEAASNFWEPVLDAPSRRTGVSGQPPSQSRRRRLIHPGIKPNFER